MKPPKFLFKVTQPTGRTYQFETTQIFQSEAEQKAININYESKSAVEVWKLDARKNPSEMIFSTRELA